MHKKYSNTPGKILLPNYGIKAHTSPILFSLLFLTSSISLSFCSICSFPMVENIVIVDDQFKESLIWLVMGPVLYYLLQSIFFQPLIHCFRMNVISALFPTKRI